MGNYCNYAKLIGPGCWYLPRWNQAGARFTFKEEDDVWVETNLETLEENFWYRQASPTELIDDEQWQKLYLKILRSYQKPFF